MLKQKVPKLKARTYNVKTISLKNHKAQIRRADGHLNESLKIKMDTN